MYNARIFRVPIYERISINQLLPSHAKTSFDNTTTTTGVDTARKVHNNSSNNIVRWPDDLSISARFILSPLSTSAVIQRPMEK